MGSMLRLNAVTLQHRRPFQNNFHLFLYERNNFFLVIWFYSRIWKDFRFFLGNQSIYFVSCFYFLFIFFFLSGFKRRNLVCYFFNVWTGNYWSIVKRNEIGSIYLFIYLLFDYVNYYMKNYLTICSNDYDMIFLIRI